MGGLLSCWAFNLKVGSGTEVETGWGGGSRYCSFFWARVRGGGGITEGVKQNFHKKITPLPDIEGRSPNKKERRGRSVSKGGEGDCRLATKLQTQHGETTPKGKYKHGDFSPLSS